MATQPLPQLSNASILYPKPQLARPIIQDHTACRQSFSLWQSCKDSNVGGDQSGESSSLSDRKLFVCVLAALGAGAHGRMVATDAARSEPAAKVVIAKALSSGYIKEHSAVPQVGHILFPLGTLDALHSVPLRIVLRPLQLRLTILRETRERATWEHTCPAKPPRPVLAVLMARRT